MRQKKKAPVQSLRSRSPRCHSHSQRSGNCSPVDKTGERGGKRSEPCTAIGFDSRKRTQIYTYQTRGVAARAVAAVSAVGKGALLATLLIALLAKHKHRPSEQTRRGKHFVCKREREKNYIYFSHRPPSAVTLLSHFHEAVAALG